MADDRWTVRGVPKAVRDSATDAALRRKVTVGAWLCQASDREINAERAPLDLMRPQAMADKSADASDRLSDAAARLALIERSVTAAIALAAEPAVPTGFRRRANRLLRESLPAPALPTIPRRRQIYLAASAGLDDAAAPNA
jgi:hypothetical protein